MSNIVAIQQPEKPLTSSEIRQQVGIIQHVLKDVMKEGTHYGKIPGTNAPSLFKAGAEKIMATFRLSVDPEVTDLSDGDQIRYQVKVRLVSPSGVFVGSGIGEASSNEEKYKWRNAVCQEEYDDTSPDRKREKWSKGYKGAAAFKKQQIRTEPADLANTILKMAKKRALIDAVLTATAASDIFTQDIEDLPPEYLDTGDALEMSDKAADWIAKIKECADMDALKNAYTQAYEDLKKSGDNTGLHALNSAKDAQKKEIANGSAH